jgi:hypothetical protein
VANERVEAAPAPGAGRRRAPRAPGALVGAALLAATCCAPPRPAPGLTTVMPTPQLERVPVADDLGQRAYEHVAALVDFGPRYTGSPGWRQALDYLAGVLRRCGLEPVRDRWTDPRFGLTFENVHVTLPGRSRHRILLACHHDTKRCEGHADPANNFYFVGANDSGSGVGLLLALAEELAKAPEPREATVQIAFFDGEESLDFKWNIDKALFGSRRFLEQYLGRRDDPLEPAPELRAMVLLDMVGARDLQIDWETNSDPQLREIIRGAARACGHEHVFFAKSQAVTDDHTPFLRAGIPAIDLIDLIDNPQWHTAEDTLEHIAAESLQLVGEVVLTALPGIERHYFAGSRLQLPERR